MPNLGDFKAGNYLVFIDFTGNFNPKLKNPFTNTVLFLFSGQSKLEFNSCQLQVKNGNLSCPNTKVNEIFS